MGVALAEPVPFDQIAIFLRAEPVIFGNQTSRAQAFFLHEIAIGVSETARRHFAQPLVIVENIGQRRFAFEQRLALVALDKGLGILAESGAR